MAQSVRERTNELAVLKTLGFTDGKVLALVLLESVCIAVLGGGAGLLVGWLLVFRGRSHEWDAARVLFPGPPADHRALRVRPGLGVAAGLLPAAPGHASPHRRCAAEELRWAAISQIVAVTALNIRTLRQRLGSSAVAIVGIAGVVAVFVAVLSIGEGFRKALIDAGYARYGDRPARRRRHRDDERPHPRDEAGHRGRRRRRARTRTGRSPPPSCSSSSTCPSDRPAPTANVPLRGVQPRRSMPRARGQIVEGRTLRARDATRSSSGARRRRSSTASQRRQSARGGAQNTWTVVGIFEAGRQRWPSRRSGPTPRVLQPAYRRGNTFQSVYAQARVGRARSTRSRTR